MPNVVTDDMWLHCVSQTAERLHAQEHRSARLEQPARGSSRPHQPRVRRVQPAQPIPGPEPCGELQQYGRREQRARRLELPPQPAEGGLGF